MNLLEQINKDKINAMREKNLPIKSVTQILSSKFQNKEIEQKRELTEEEIILIVRKELKQTEESFKDAQKAIRDTAEYEAQIAYLKSLLPAAMTTEQIQEMVNAIAKETASLTKGEVMRAVMEQMKGKADGKLISAAVDQYIASKA